ncbi:MAG: hypothetical protein NT025_05065 [bacterium]|nr:hypothetical protein [bacterium]
MSRICTALLVLAWLALPASAQPQQSEDFRITKSVIDAGGAAGASADFRLYGAFGQGTPVGQQTSADFALYAGYLSPSFAVSSLSAIQDLVILVAPPDVHLNWDPIAGAERYKVFRATSASFAPEESNRIATVPDTFYVDVNATTLPGTRYYYCVEASNTPHPLIAQSPAVKSAFAPASKRHEEAPATPLRKKMATKTVPSATK